MSTHVSSRTDTTLAGAQVQRLGVSQRDRLGAASRPGIACGRPGHGYKPMTNDQGPTAALGDQALDLH